MLASLRLARISQVLVVLEGVIDTFTLANGVCRPLRRHYTMVYLH